MFSQPVSSQPASAVNDALHETQPQPPIYTGPHRFAFLAVTNPFFARGRQARYLPNLFVVLALALVLAILTALPSQLLRPLLQPFYTVAETGSPTPTATVQTVQHLLNYLPLFGLLAVWLRWGERRPFWTLGFPTVPILRQAASGLLVGCVLYLVPVAVAALFGQVTWAAGPVTQQGMAALGGVLIALVGWLVQGAAEETLTRGWLLQVIGLRYRPWLGVLVASLFFSLLHALNPEFNTIAAINLALFGLFTALYVLRSGNLWGVAALHAAANWTQGNLIGVPISGRLGAGGTLVNLEIGGPDWLAGGGFGPEGGLLMTVTLLLGVLVLFWWPRP